MVEEIPKTVYITSSNDLGKLRVDVVFDSVEYLPTSRQSIALVKVLIVYPDSEYSYGGFGMMTGDAYNSTIMKFKFEGAKISSDLTANLRRKAEKELAQVKKEIQDILNVGAKKVAVDLNEALMRITSALGSEKGL
jgi:hypothetical protein